MAKRLINQFKAIYALFCAIFEPDSYNEKQKDKEIDWETKTWGDKK